MLHPPLRHNDTPALAVNVGVGERLSVQAIDHTTDDFVGPSVATAAHQLIARIASDGLTRAPSVTKKKPTSNIKRECLTSTSYKLGSLAYGSCDVRERL